MATTGGRAGLPRTEIHPLDLETSHHGWPPNEGSHNGRLRRRRLVSTAHPDAQRLPRSDPKPSLQGLSNLDSVTFTHPHPCREQNECVLQRSQHSRPPPHLHSGAPLPGATFLPVPTPHFTACSVPLGLRDSSPVWNRLQQPQLPFNPQGTYHFPTNISDTHILKTFFTLLTDKLPC